VTLRASGPRDGSEPAGAPADPAAHRPNAWGELAIGLLLFGLYIVGDHLSGPSRLSAARQHGWDLLNAERALGVPVEEWLNAWLAPHEVLRVIANYEYAFTYVASALWLLVWLWLRRPETYRWARNSFVLLNVIAMACFAVWPVAPPRLLPGAGFVDTVTEDATIGSWGSPLVTHANQMAAMPSLHIAWALWVSVVLACVSGRWWVQAISAVHVSVTAFVIMATGNHYWLDAVGGAVLVWLSLAVLSVFGDRPGKAVPGPRLASADAFFLPVDTPATPQHICGLVVMDDADPDTYRKRLAATVHANVHKMPRFRQVLSPPSRWRRPRWLPAGDLDWDWHVPEVDLTRPDGTPGGFRALDEVVAGVQASTLPRDRPLWRWMAITGLAPGKVAALMVVHHAVADGLGGIAHAFYLLDPVPPPPELPPTVPSSARMALGVAVGVAQLATDGSNKHPLPAGADDRRRFGRLAVPLAEVREVAHAHGVRISDVLLSVAAGALRRVLDPADAPPTVRTSVPLMMRVPESTAEGNVTAAVMIDLSLGAEAEAVRLAETARASRRLRTGTRALGSRFVMNVVGTILPPRLLALFARTVYGRRYFSAIVSNMPGPVGSYRLGGGALKEVYPVLPLAPRAPLAVGVIGWDGTLFVGVSLDPALVDDADRFVLALRAVLDELSPVPSPPRDRVEAERLARSGAGTGGPDGDDGRLHASASTSRDRLSGVSNAGPNRACS
jgi:diacylglycerol O-acyltransferase